MYSAVQTGISSFAAAQVLDVFARSALALSGTKSGANNLALMLSLKPTNAECAPTQLAVNFVDQI